MSDHAQGNVLAFVPHEMRKHMKELEAATPGHLKRVSSIEELIHSSAEDLYAVVLIPATGFTSEQWWSVWGCVNTMEPRPSILVYAVRSDFEMWSSVLESGGYDVVVTPFTAEKLRHAIEAAAAEFVRQTNH
jgi:FixJ family two-component response regulator